MQNIIVNSQECQKNYLMFVKFPEDENRDVNTKCKFIKENHVRPVC